MLLYQTQLWCVLVKTLQTSTINLTKRTAQFWTNTCIQCVHVKRKCAMSHKDRTVLSCYKKFHPATFFEFKARAAVLLWLANNRILHVFCCLQAANQQIGLVDHDFVLVCPMSKNRVCVFTIITYTGPLNFHNIEVYEAKLKTSSNITSPSPIWIYHNIDTEW